MSGEYEICHEHALDCSCNEWIDWDTHPVPEDIKGIFIKYEDGVFCDRYDFESKKRKYREGKILGWKFMERSDQDKKTIHCNEHNEKEKKEQTR